MKRNEAGRCGTAPKGSRRCAKTKAGKGQAFRWRKINKRPRRCPSEAFPSTGAAPCSPGFPVPSALRGLTSLFGMVRGGSPAPRPPCLMAAIDIDGSNMSFIEQAHRFFLRGKLSGY